MTTPTCDYSNCTEPATARYEGHTPPDGTFRFNACDNHTPDAPPVEDYQ